MVVVVVCWWGCGVVAEEMMDGKLWYGGWGSDSGGEE